MPTVAAGGYIPIGAGIGAAVLADGRLNVVAGPLFAQIERERRDGPRWCALVTEGRLLREMTWVGWRQRSPGIWTRTARPDVPFHDDPVSSVELTGGIPVGWITRP